MVGGRSWTATVGFLGGVVLVGGVVGATDASATTSAQTPSQSNALVSFGQVQCQSRLKVKAVRASVKRSSAVVRARIHWDKNMMACPAATRAYSIRMVTRPSSRGGAPIVTVYNMRSSKSRPAVQSIVLRLGPGKAKALRRASWVVLSVSQQVATQRRAVFNHNWAVVTKIPVKRSAATGALSNAALSRGTLRNCSGIPIQPGADLRDCDLRGVNLAKVDLSGADLTGADLSGADLSGANLQGANLTGANLTGASITGARIPGVRLGGATLTAIRSGGVVGTPATLPPEWSLVNGTLVAADTASTPQATAIGDGTVSLSWTAPKVSTRTLKVGYYAYPSGLYYYLPGCDNLPGTATTCTATGLTNGVSYVFNVVAKMDGFPWLTKSPFGGPFTPATIPAQPASPSASPSGDGSLTVNWTAPSSGGAPITGYNVQVRTHSPVGAWSNATGCTGLGDVLACTAKGLANNVGYDFRVMALNAMGPGPYSEPGGPFTPVGVPAQPAAPTSPSTGNGSVTLNWTAPSSGGLPVTGYNVQVRTHSPEGTWSNATGCTALGNVLACTASGLANEVGYDFRVRALNAMGPGPYSEPGGPFTPVGVPAKPAAPTSPSTGNGSVTLNWTAPSSGGAPIIGYNVQVRTRSPEGTWNDATGCTGLGNVLTCTAIGLANDVGYDFRVMALNATGPGPYSEPGGPFTPVGPPS